ncbi:hypothetical protein HBI81_116730 [Parastagonospora nodorum]|nr:hypothetical protein HBI09_125430 [Parastagonospora nodorum]KAH4119421.1 hypothetical protein HBH47_127110 [Parastagonospora nodorum]KAH4221111.1 hypothetical protein HBI06_161930 [Parastagonospora nodorum]KAH4247797.1 hypothetical protein HBI05_032150 [Parastagonospora nodorum]KAH4598873.1 hypothetical protein HBH82_213540 [Parastagonospora nodorum]
MASKQVDESAQFQEPISPTASNDATSPAPASGSADSAKPSITGILKNAVKAPSHEKIVNDEPDMKDAIESVGQDGGERGV